jgi:hypothetical protein
MRMAQPVVRIRSVTVNGSEVPADSVHPIWDVTVIVELGAPDLTELTLSFPESGASLDEAVSKALGEVNQWEQSIGDAADKIRRSMLSQ